MELIYLSRRNLLTLLSKLDRRAEGDVTQCSIIKQDMEHPLFPASMAPVMIVAVDDDEYYADRKPGVVHPLDTPKG